VCAWRDGRVEVVFTLPRGSGPSGLGLAQEGSFWVCLYSALKLVHVSPTGAVLQEIDRYHGECFKGPNDLAASPEGDVYFTDAGNFADDWVTGRPNGTVYHLSAAGELQQVDSGLCYPNGVALTPDRDQLIINEHRQNRLLQYRIGRHGALVDKRVFFEMDTSCLLPEELAYELGPDGLCLDDRGNRWVAHYGAGQVVKISPQGELVARIHLPQGKKPTSVAFAKDEGALYVTEAELGVLYRVDLD
jgi:gluconolactonase